MIDCFETQEFLKKAYLDYFSQVLFEKIGGKDKIHHLTACRSLVKEGKLRKTKYGFSLKTTSDKAITAYFKRYPWQMYKYEK